MVSDFRPAHARPNPARVGRARILVIGAGPLGREVVGRLADNGVRRMVLVDPGVVTSEMAGSDPFFPEGSEGMSKAVAVSNALRGQGVAITPLKISANGIEGWSYDVVLGCTEAISERLHANRCAVIYDLVYIDGALDGGRGRVQVVLPGGPCLECGISVERRGVAKEPERTPPEQGSLKKTADIMVDEALSVLAGSRRHPRGVLFIDGEGDKVDEIAMGVDQTCPNHRTRMRR